MFFSALVVLPLEFSSSPSGKDSGQEQPTIVLEHTEAHRANISIQSVRGNTLIEIGNSDDRVLKISVPLLWKQWEIRGADITELVSEEPGLGYVTWHIPPHSIVSFITENLSSPITLHHPVSALLTLSVTRINLDRGTSEKNVYLLQKERKIID